MAMSLIRWSSSRLRPYIEKLCGLAESAGWERPFLFVLQDRDGVAAMHFGLWEDTDTIDGLENSNKYVPRQVPVLVLPLKLILIPGNKALEEYISGGFRKVPEDRLECNIEMGGEPGSKVWIN